jgi:hypothetical protein
MANLDNLNKWLTLIANFGVVLGIIFLGIEISQNNDALDAQTRNYWVERRMVMMHMMISDPELETLLRKSTAGMEPLTETEIARAGTVGYRLMVSFAHQFDEFSRGRLDESEIINLHYAVYHSEFNNFRVPEVWPLYKRQEASPEFVLWFEENVVKPR